MTNTFEPKRCKTKVSVAMRTADGEYLEIEGFKDSSGNMILNLLHITTDEASIPSALCIADFEMMVEIAKEVSETVQKMEDSSDAATATD